jgi:hypothetical protein
MSSAAQAAYFPTHISEASELLTLGQEASFLGAPDDSYTGLGSEFITYDLGDHKLIDGSGQDVNVYEVDSGNVEFSSMQIFVSADGSHFFDISGSIGPAVDLVGDEAHGNASFRKSYDVGDAVLGLGASAFQFVRIQGTGSGGISTNNGFDLDAIGIVNHTAGGVPEPGAWALMILGFGGIGWSARRRRGFAAA